MTMYEMLLNLLKEGWPAQHPVRSVLCEGKERKEIKAQHNKHLPLIVSLARFFSRATIENNVLWHPSDFLPSACLC